MQYLQILDDVLMSENVLKDYENAMSNRGFASWLNHLLPEFSECAKLKQDNPWHIYNCLEHILHSVEEMNKQTKSLPQEDRRLLSYTMFYHDMGKPATHLRRYSETYKREVDSYFSHNIKSSEIVWRTAGELGFSESQIKQLERLVFDHDIFMFITEENDFNPYHRVLSAELIRERVNELSQIGDGQKLMHYLILIGKADNKAQNPAMTEGSLNLLDKMEKILDEMEFHLDGKQLQ